MDPITSSALMTILSFWGGKAFDRAFDTLSGEFTKDSFKWFKSLFFVDGKPSDTLRKYEENPESPARLNTIKAAIEAELEEQPNAKEYVLEISDIIKAKLSSTTTIKNGQNINTGTINSGQNTVIGNHNKL